VNLLLLGVVLTLVVGGQEGIYPAKLCVDLNTAFKAAKTFALLGTLEKSVIWEQEGVVERV
jgi:Immunity protein Imm1